MKTIIHRSWIIVMMLWASLCASAYDFEVDGIYYNITSMADLEVEVTYGSIEKFQWYNKNTTSYPHKVAIPSSVNYTNKTFTVVGIGEGAFGNIGKDGEPLCFMSNPSEVTQVILPNTIKYIATAAFQGCQKLVDIQFSQSLESIGYAAFAYTGVDHILLPQALKEIGVYAFYSSKLTHVTLPDGVFDIKEHAFERSLLRCVILGSTLSYVGTSAFADCSSLIEVFCTSITRPAGLYSSTFSGSHSALEVYVPSVKEYGFGREYLTFPTSQFNYSGQAHNIEWVNNLKAYKCEIKESECKTEINAGEYTKSLTATYSNGVDFSVEIPYSYTINKAPMTLTVNNAQREYGDSNPAFTCDISGFVSGENEQTLGATPSFDCEATQSSKVGHYRILAELTAPNYDITYKYGTLSVLKAPLTVSVVDASKIYGNDNPAFSLSFSGLKNGETSPAWSKNPLISTPATTESGVGQYEISVSDAVAVNYDITKYNPGTLTVSKRDLTAKANDCERLYDEENPAFEISYIGFVNGDSKSSLAQQPIAECTATKESNAGTYPIVVTGGEAGNYNFLYQDGTLKINPLTVGFKDVYNSVTYNVVDISTSDSYFNYIPEIIGPFSNEDFWIELWFLDKDNKYPQHVTTITGGDYAGNYVNTNLDRPMWAGKYIFNLVSKGTNPNVTANPARAYLTVNRASNNLTWDVESPITLKVGEKVDLGISYQADIWCTFNTEYDEDLIDLSSTEETGNHPHWYATGLQEGETILYFAIECHKNDMGFYDFTDSRTLSKRIKVEPDDSGISEVRGEDSIRISKKNGTIVILNKPAESIVRIFTLQGTPITETQTSEIDNLDSGLYIVTVGDRAFKIAI